MRDRTNDGPARYVQYREEFARPNRCAFNQLSFKRQAYPQLNSKEVSLCSGRADDPEMLFLHVDVVSNACFLNAHQMVGLFVERSFQML